MSEEKQKRVRVGLEDFLRVAVVQRSQFDTMQAAAEKLGYIALPIETSNMVRQYWAETK